MYVCVCIYPHSKILLRIRYFGDGEIGDICVEIFGVWRLMGVKVSRQYLDFMTFLCTALGRIY